VAYDLLMNAIPLPYCQYMGIGGCHPLGESLETKSETLNLTSNLE